MQVKSNNSLLIQLFTAMFIFVSIGWSQPIDTYRPMENEGLIPEVFLTSLDDRVASQLEDQTKNSKDFLTNINFNYQELLLSGKVMFGNSLCRYVEQIGVHLLESENDSVKNKINFFILKSDVVNAFTTNDGNVFITIGLMAQIENESQLAFILSHEIEHYKQQHIINDFHHRQNLNDEHDNLDFSDLLIRNSKFSHSQENEADTSGFKRLVRAGYSLENVIGVFDVLEFGYLPLEEFIVERSFFESAEIKYDTCFLKKTAPINFEVEDEDQYSSHPSIASRRSQLQILIDQHISSSGFEFLIDEHAFDIAKKSARFELIQIQYYKNNPEEGIYNAYCLLKIYPNDPFLEKQLCIGLYLMSKLKYEDVTFTDYTKITGRCQQMFYFLQHADKDDLLLTSIHFIMRLYDKTRDPHLMAMLVDQVALINEKMKLSVEDFGPIKDSLLIAQASKTDSLVQGLSKYDKIRQLKSEGNITYSFKSDNTKLNELFELDSFPSFFKSAQNKYEKLKVKLERDKYQTAALIDTLTVVAPRHFSLTKTKQQFKFNTAKSSELCQSFTEHLLGSNEYGEKAHLKSIDSRILNSEDVSKFNDFVLLQEYMNFFETNYQFDYFTPLNYNRIEAFKKRTNIKYIAHLDMVSIKQRIKVQPEAAILLVLFYPAYPFTIPYFLRKHYFAYSRMMIVDLENHQFIRKKFYRRKANPKYSHHVITSVKYLLRSIRLYNPS